MSERILIINPNSTEAVTENISAALDCLRFADGPTLECITLTEGPPGVESQRDADGVIGPICRVVERERDGTAAFVIACFSDPGLYSAREISPVPVFGIAQSGISAALAIGERFGIISILERSIPRHLRYIGALGLADRLGGDMAIGLGVTELEQGQLVFQRMAEVGARLQRECRVDVIVLGCAGMARYRAGLEDRLGIAVIDPTQAAAAAAIAAVRTRAPAVETPAAAASG